MVSFGSQGEAALMGGMASRGPHRHRHGQRKLWNFNLLSNGANNKGSSMAGDGTGDGAPGIILHDKGRRAMDRVFNFSTCSDFDAQRAHEALNIYLPFPEGRHGHLYAEEPHVLRFAQAIQEYLKKAQYKKKACLGLDLAYVTIVSLFLHRRDETCLKAVACLLLVKSGLSADGMLYPLTPVEAVYTPEPRQKCTERYIESSCDRRFFEGVQGANTTIIGGGIVRSGFSSIDDESCWILWPPSSSRRGIIEQGCPPVDLSPFQIDGGADEVEEAAEIGYNTPKAMVSVARQFARCQPVLGLMWVRHPEHGLVRRSARIAARTTCKP
ncbi:hypothetical protein ACHAW5_008773 [Stephanodiscus triporus]|uniref:Cyclin N-terminal domain-containing protein n=1 Tax=Stephanodiscus triporus TaxID=2934178 RepID=A0ABD3P6J9_9STRA